MVIRRRKQQAKAALAPQSIDLQTLVEALREAIGTTKPPTADQPANMTTATPSERFNGRWQARKVYAVTGGNPKMYPTTEKVLEYLKTRPNATRNEITSATGMNAGTVKFALRQLVQLGLVKVIDIKPNGE